MLADVGLRLLIVDDNASFLEAARGLLEREGLDVVGMAADSTSALDLAGATHPDVVLVDVDLGEESGLTLARTLADLDGQLAIVLISAYPEEDLAGLVDEAPVRGFIDKRLLSRRAIERLLDG